MILIELLGNSSASSNEFGVIARVVNRTVTTARKASQRRFRGRGGNRRIAIFAGHFPKHRIAAASSLLSRPSHPCRPRNCPCQSNFASTRVLYVPGRDSVCAITHMPLVLVNINWYSGKKVWRVRFIRTGIELVGPPSPPRNLLRARKVDSSSSAGKGEGKGTR